MKKFLKVFAALASVLIILVVALIVLANILITPERVKNTLLPLVEENIDRKVDLGEIQVSLLSGIEIHGLKIYERESQDVFVSTDLVRLRYQLLPLLAMKVVIDEVRLQKPSIRVVRYRDNRFNFSDLLADSDSQPTKDTAPAQKDVAEGSAGTPISLLVSNVLIEDGQVVFLDHVLNDKAPYRYEISSLQAAAKGVSLAGNMPVTLQCQINGSQLGLNGTVSLLPLGGSFDIDLQSLDVVAFNPYLAGAIPGTLGGLKLNVKSAVSGNLDEVSLKGLITLSDLDLQLDALPEAPLQKARIDINLDLLYAPPKDQLQVRQLGIDYNGINVAAVGDISDLMGSPDLNLKVTVPKLQIRKAVTALPQGLVGDVSALDPAGIISAEATVTGTLVEGTALLRSAKIELEDVEATAGDFRPAFSGRLLMAGEKLTSEGLQVRLGDNRADINLKASRLLTPPIVLQADITSERFLLEPLLLGSAGPAAAAGKNESGVKSTDQAVETELGPFDIPLHASGTIKVTEAIWKGLSIKNFLALYELKDNIFNLTRMNGEVAGGSFSNSARVDLGKKGLAYSANLNLKKVQADPLMTAFVPKAAGSLLGAMDLDFAMQGRGTVWQSLNRNLTGSGNVLVADGRLTSQNLVNGLKSFLQLPELKDIKFDNFKGQFNIVDGKVKIDSQMLGSMLKLFLQGTVGMDGGLNMAMDTRLSPEMSAKLDNKGSVASYLADNEGWTRIPLLIKGDLESPQFRLDPKGVQEQASKAISKELGRQLEKLYKPSNAEPKSTGQKQPQDGAVPKEDPAKKLLEDSLKKLFGN